MTETAVGIVIVLIEASSLVGTEVALSKAALLVEIGKCLRPESLLVAALPLVGHLHLIGGVIEVARAGLHLPAAGAVPANGFVASLHLYVNILNEIF